MYNLTSLYNFCLENPIIVLSIIAIIATIFVGKLVDKGKNLFFIIVFVAIAYFGYKYFC